jgi:U3 small nucleolar RNA-associated protein 19
MRLLNERATHILGDDNQAWTSGLFPSIFEAVIEARDGQALRSEFLENFVKPYDDVTYHTFMQVAYVALSFGALICVSID